MANKTDPSPSKESARFFGARKGERSFSLLETIVAVSLVAMLMVEVSGVHGNSIAFNEYGRKVLQASYLAKRLMSQVEYQATIKSPLKELRVNETDKPFEDAPDFSYTIAVEPLPHAIDMMFKIFSGGMAGQKSDSEDAGSSDIGAILEQMKSMINQAVGEEPIWVAKVSVSWAEGARRSSTDLAMVIADTKKLEDGLGKLMDIASVGGGAGIPGVPNSGVPNSGATSGPVPEKTGAP